MSNMSIAGSLRGWLGQDRPLPGQYTHLKPELILATIDKLEARIGERFPDSGLRKVCREVQALSRRADALSQELARPLWAVRWAALLAGGLLLGLVLWALAQLSNHFTLKAEGMPDMLQAAESAINELIFLGLALFTLMNLEDRLKRRAALRSLHQLRSVAHVVDMHQLTKDPAHLLARMPDTESSPERIRSRHLLTRYLDYCAELLSLIAKVGALFGQNMEDPVVLAAVNDIEELTQGLSAKIWQKIMILDLAEEENKA
jgi:hypothetical protein